MNMPAGRDVRSGYVTFRTPDDEMAGIKSRGYADVREHCRSDFVKARSLQGLVECARGFCESPRSRRTHFLIIQRVGSAGIFCLFIHLWSGIRFANPQSNYNFEQRHA